MQPKIGYLPIAIVSILLLAFFLPYGLFNAFFDGIITSGQDPIVQGIKPYNSWFLWVRMLENSGAYTSFENWRFSLKWYSFLALTPCLPFLGSYALYRYQKKRTDIMKSAQTSAVFAKHKDLKEYIGKDGLILSKNIRMTKNSCFGHFLIVGPTGSGKTVSFFLPNIISLQDEYSAVITDPKGELYQTTGNFHLQRKRRVEIIKLDCKEASARWNPLDLPTDMVMMSKVCSSIVKNKGGDSGGGGDQDFWDATAIDLLMAIVYIVKSIPGTYGNFRNAYMILSECSFESMIGLAKHAVATLGPEVRSVLTRAASFGDDVAPEDTRNSTRFVLKTALAPFMIDAVSYITANTTIDFRDLKRHPTALYVSMPEHKVEGVKPVLSTLYMQIFDALLDMGQGGRPVFMLFDEFANVGKIIGFPQYIATIRSRNLSVAVCLQSIEQLTRNYSEPEKQEITNNLKTMAILPGLKEEKTLQYIQTVAGKVSEYERSSEKEDKRTFAKDRLPLSEVRELEDNAKTGEHEVIILLPNKPPYKDKQRRSYLDPEITKILKNTPSLDMPNQPASVFEEIERNCFLTPGDITFLETVGSYIFYEGKIDKIPDDKKLQGLKKFEALSHICGLPNVTLDTEGKIAIKWPEKSASTPLNGRGRVARKMIENSFVWLHEAGIMHVTKK
jgi:type IV secretion system protein VirD4